MQQQTVSRLSRAERRNLMRQEAALLEQPLNLGQDPRPSAAHVRHLVHVLRTPAAASPCSDAVAHLNALYDRTIPKRSVDAIACRRGCSHCCVQLVSLTAPEAFFVAARARLRPKLAAAVAEINERTKGMSIRERIAARIPCPLLEETVCAVYAARPLGCHGFVSADLNACLAAFTQGAEPNIPMPNDNISIMYVCRMILMAALRLAGLPGKTYEMNSAVAAILALDNAEERWLGGEDILAGLELESVPPPQFDKAISDMAAFVAPTI